jgi:hypothetical protein
MTGIITSPENVDCEFGIISSDYAPTIDRPARDRGRPEPTAANPLERLAQLMHSNDRLMEELATVRRRIVRAREYMLSPKRNFRFAAENLAHCKNKHRGVLAQLRANRIEANRILGLDRAAS